MQHASLERQKRQACSQAWFVHFCVSCISGAMLIDPSSEPFRLLPIGRWRRFRRHFRSRLSVEFSQRAYRGVLRAGFEIAPFCCSWHGWVFELGRSCSSSWMILIGRPRAFMSVVRDVRNVRCHCRTMWEKRSPRICAMVDRHRPAATFSCARARRGELWPTRPRYQRLSAALLSVLKSSRQPRVRISFGTLSPRTCCAEAPR